MKAASKSLKKRRSAAARPTLTLSVESYQKIDDMRGDEARSIGVQDLIEREERARVRRSFADTLAEQYTPDVCRETLRVHDEFPLQEH